MASTPLSVDKSLEIARLRAFRDLSPKLKAFEHAALLEERLRGGKPDDERQVSAPQISKFEVTGGRTPLPHGLTFEDWREALVEWKRANGATEAQIAPWIGVAA